MKHAIIGDIHGRYDLLLSLISRLEYNGIELGKDTLVFLGDYCDRGKQSKEVIEYVSMLKTQYGDKIVLLKGNHEQLAKDYILTSNPENRVEAIMGWLFNGGRDTRKSFGEEGLDAVLLPFINSLQVSYQTDDFICVHGGIPNGKSLNTATEFDLLWNRDNDNYRGKLLIVGHTIVDRVHQIWDTIYIDTGAYASGKLSAVIMPNRKFVSTNGVSTIPTPINIKEDVYNDTLISKVMSNSSAFATWVKQAIIDFITGMRTP